MIIAHIRKWGNSLAIRLPKTLLALLDLREGSQVEISIDRDRLILSPVKKPKYTLEELLSQITPESLHDEIDFSSPNNDLEKGK
jgi:antitoxin MazE